ncbi:SecY protein [Pisolithus marmoratus]|nr:SecY protein [Pisolithus marmoratus]KAI6030220.1 SecY protein [Pisolithus marmoratus]
MGDVWIAPACRNLSEPLQVLVERVSGCDPYLSLFGTGHVCAQACSLQSLHRFLRIRFLNLVRPFLPILPEVSSPDRKVRELQHSTVWNYVLDSSDPLYWMRVILASNRGTLMELGISPIVTSGMIMQLLAGANLIEVDFSLKEDRALSACPKTDSYVLTGLYGQPKDLGAGVCLLLVIQLVVAAHCHPSRRIVAKRLWPRVGISLFIATNVCESIIWKAFSPTTVNTGRGPEFEGRALREAFWRDRLPNVMNLLATVVVFAAVIYLQGFRIEIPVKSNRFRGQRGAYPVKLFTPRNADHAPIRSYIECIHHSQMLANRFPSNFLVKLLGVGRTHHTSRVGGIAYYMSPPYTLKEALLDPFHTLLYIAFVTWIEVSGSGPREIAKQLKDQQMVRTS